MIICLGLMLYTTELFFVFYDLVSSQSMLLIYMYLAILRVPVMVPLYGFHL